MGQENISLLTALAAAVTIVSAAVAPALSAHVTKKWEYKTKKLELFFREKSSAYTGFFRYFDTMEIEVSDSELGDKAEIISKAFLFAPPNLKRKLSNFLSAKSEEESKRLRMELLELMRKDLEK